MYSAVGEVSTYVASDADNAATPGHLLWNRTELAYIARRAATFPQEPLVVRRFTPALRIWIFIAAFAQAVLPGVASVIDASTAAGVASASVRPHAEAPGTHRGPRVHQEDNCALCQFVSGSVAPAGQAGPTPLPTSKPQQVVRRRALAPEWLADGTPSLPRAPPQTA